MMMMMDGSMEGRGVKVYDVCKPIRRCQCRLVKGNYFSDEASLKRRGKGAKARHKEGHERGREAMGGDGGQDGTR